MNRDRMGLLIVLGLVLLGVVLILVAMRWGVGLQPDSAGYIGSAQNLLDGRGLIMPLASEEPEPLTVFPPLYPYILAAFGLTGAPLLELAVWVNVLLLGLNIALFCGMIYSLTNASLIATLIGGLLIVFSVDLLRAHTMVLTEALFVLTGFAGLWLVATYSQYERIWQLVAAGLLMAMALMTRFAGYAFIGVGGLALLLLARAGLMRRLMVAVLFGLLSVAPLAVWNWITQQTYGAATGRTIAFHPPTLSDVQTGVFSLTRWIFPEDWIRAVAGNTTLLLLAGAIGTLLLLIVVIWLWRQWSASPGAISDVYSWLRSQPSLVIVLVLFAFSYPAFLLVSLTFFDAFTPLTNRILLPAYCAVLVLAVYWGWCLAGWLQRRQLQGALRTYIGLVVLFVCLQIGRGIGQVYNDFQAGIGFTEQVWREAVALDYVRALPIDAVIYSNNPEALYLLTGRSTWMFPRQYNPQSLGPNASYEAEMAQMAERLRSADGIIAFFYSPNSLRDHFPDETGLAGRYTLEPVVADAAGTVYRLFD